jgi:hypothetical protein
MDGWGPQTDTLIQVAEALQSFVGGKTSNAELIRTILYAQKQHASNHAMERTPKAFASRLADRCAFRTFYD